MKKLILSAVLLTLAFTAFALTTDTNVALNQISTGTFSNLAGATDGLIAVSGAAVSGNVSEAPQIITIDLGSAAYVGAIKIFWDKNAYSKNYAVRTSGDAKNWSVELSGADASTGVTDDRTGAISQNITGKRFADANRYIQIYIPLNGAVTGANGTVRIAEVQVFPAAEQRIAIEDVSPYVVSGKKAILAVKTNIGAGRASVVYGLAPEVMDQIGAVHEVGQLTSATLSNLTLDKAYFYQARVWDLYGNMAESRVMSLAPAKDNIALGKKVDGTFTELPPNDSYVDRVKNVLSRVNDGATSYFTAMATSRSVNSGDQYAVIDLGLSVPIANVITYWRNLAYPLSFDVQLSNDGANYSGGAEKLNAASGAFSRSETGDPMRVLSAWLNGASARYVKILVKKDSPCYQKHADWNFVQLMEIEVIPQ